MEERSFSSYGDLETMTETLAIHGGKKVTEEDFPLWPQFAEKTDQDIIKPLKNGLVNYWTGTQGMKFEEMWAEWIGAEMAISCTNGTSALHIAIASLGIGPGDEVIVPTYSFIASSFAILQAGAIPVFCDSQEDHTIDTGKIEELITEKTKAVIVVHLYGVVCDMDPILDIAKRHGLKVIEDCAQCFGGTYKGQKAGTIGDAGCFSFCQSKHFTTGGEGGMVVVNDEELGWQCRSFRDHGYDVKERMHLFDISAKLPYVHTQVGFNYRMTEFQSIVGINELERFESWNLPNRFKYAKMYDEAFENFAGIEAIPLNTPERKNAYWHYPILLDMDLLKCDITQFVKALNEEGIPASGIQWPEAYQEEVYTNLNGFGDAQFPFKSKEYTDSNSVQYDQCRCDVARGLQEKTVTLFLHPTWREIDIERTIAGVKKVIAHYSQNS